MAKSADEFLNDLAARELVPAEIVASLRRQVAKSAQPVGAAAIAKLLTDNGHLTAVQAQQLLGGAAPPNTTPLSKPPQPGADLGLTPLDDSLTPLGEAELMPLDGGLTPLGEADGLAPIDELGLTPLDDDVPQSATKSAPAKPVAKPASKPAAKPPVKAPATTAPSVAAKAKTATPPAHVAGPADLAPLEGLAPMEGLSPLEPAGGAAGLAEIQSLDAPSGLDPLADASLAGPLAAAPAGASPAKPAKRGSSLWLMLGGLAVVLLLAGVGGAALFLLPRGTGEEEMELAEKDYEAKQYDGAIAKYDALLAKYPQSPRASLARVHRAAAQVLAARAASPRDWQPVLAASQEALPAIGGEPGLAKAHAELAPLLEEMAVSLSEQAAQAGSPDEAATKLAQARQALALADDGRFVPGSLRDWQRMELAHESLALAEHSIAAAKLRDEAIAAMNKAIAAKDAAAALAERAKLLATDPQWASDASVQELGKSLAAAAAAAVTPETMDFEPVKSEARPAVAASLVVASAAPADNASTGSPVCIIAAGSAWGVDSTAGRLLWRRPVGEGPAAQPVALPGGDVLLCDSLRSEVLRVAAADGALRWRIQIAGAAAGPPLFLGEQILVTTRAGQVIALEAQSGTPKAAVQLPQSLRVPAASDSAGKLLYVLGDDALIYVFSTADLQPVGAFYLGHEPAAVAVAPAVLARHVVAIENRGTTSAVLRVMTLNSGGLPQAAVQQLEVSGQVFAAPVVWDARLVVLTDAGRVLVFESADDADEGLKQIAAADAGSEPVIRYGSLQGGKLLVAGQGLRLFGPPASGGLRQEWLAAAEHVCLGPPQIADSLVLSVHPGASTSSPQLSAIQMSDGKQAWQAPLVEPIVAAVPADSNNQAAIAVTDSGVVTKLDVAGAGGLTVQSIPADAAKTPPLTIVAAIGLPGGRHVLVPDGQPAELLVLDADSDSARPLSLPGLLGGMPIAWRDGIVVPCTSGAVAWIDPQTGQLKADAFQLRLVPGMRLSGCRLASAGKGGEELIVADGRGTLIRVALATDPQPHLAELASVQLQSPVTGLVATGSTVGVVDRRGQWQSFNLPDLAPASAPALAARAFITGPTRIGDHYFVATDHDELVCFDGTLQQVWKVPLPHGPLADQPVADSSGILIATQSGWLCRIALDSGKEVAHVDLGQSLRGSPLVVGDFALVPAADGTLLKVALSALEAAQP